MNACTETKWIAFHEPSVIVNDDYSTFKTATTSVWVPDDSVDNGIISTVCAFNYKCSGNAFIIRLKINGNVTSPIEVEGKDNWCWSRIFTQKDR